MNIKSENKSKILRVLPWLVIAIITFGAMALFLFSPDDTTKISNESSGEVVGQTFPMQGRDHIKPGEPHPAYNSNPPTSGWHYEKADEWGFYEEEKDDEQLVHNIEHGGIWIAYKDIDEETKGKLKELSKRYPGSVIITPRAANDGKIAVVAWTKLEKMEIYDEGRIEEFIKLNKNKSPEPFAK